jgi:malonyl-CoA O-methyltransferase
MTDITAATLAAYERWAPLYPPLAHNPVMRAEELAMLEFWPEVAGRRALDLASGSGRYSQLLSQTGAEQVVALDFCMPMLRQVRNADRVCASMVALPFQSGVFDVVVSGLAIGHAPDVRTWMAEAARVLRPGGTLLYSDFHSDAAQAGLTRSFKDENEQNCTVPHHNYSAAAQEEAAAAAGLTVDRVHHVRVGLEMREPFPKSTEFYRCWHGLPIVLVVRARK